MKDFEPSDYWDANVAKRQDRYSHLAMAAAKMALKDGGCDPKASDRTALHLNRPPSSGRRHPASSLLLRPAARPGGGARPPSGPRCGEGLFCQLQ